MDVLLDTNILVGVVNPASADYPLIWSAVEAVVDRGDRVCFISQNLVELWNVCTRPARYNGLGLSVKETDRRLRVLEADFLLLPDTERVHAEWRRLVVQYSVSVVQVHDTRIVAAMLAHGVSQLLTLNARDFKRFTEITAVHPRDFVAA